MRIPMAAITLSLIVLGSIDPAAAQERGGVMADLIAAIARLESKVVALAKAIPESAYDWRPSPGVRSIGEVFIHVAADNYFAAANMGAAVQPDTGITGKSYKEAEAYEGRKLTRAEVITALERSFVLLKQSMTSTPEDRLESTTNYFGPKRPTRLRTAWIGMTTHLHEHLGQLIAYARSNKVVPPWSQ